MVKTLIIDDENGAVNLLRMTLERNYPGGFDIEESNDSEEGILKIKTFKPHLVFLDIEMPRLSGFDLLTSITKIDFKVIFTTAFDQYAIRAIRYNALDYLLKPVCPKELDSAIARFQKFTSESIDVYEQQVKNLLDDKKKKLAITTCDGVVFLDIDKIIRCEADLNYTRFILAERKLFLSSKTLKEYEDLLAEHPNFIRVHRSHLVNINYILDFKHEGLLVLKDESSIPVARRRKDEVIRKLNTHCVLSV